MTAALVCIGSLLVIFNVLAIRKEKKSFSNTLNNAEINVTDMDVRIGALRKEFAETLLELQKEIRDLELKVEELKDTELHIDHMDIDSVHAEKKYLRSDNNDFVDKVSHEGKELSDNKRVYNKRSISNTYAENSKLRESMGVSKTNTEDILEVSENVRINKQNQKENKVENENHVLEESNSTKDKNDEKVDVNKVNANHPLDEKNNDKQLEKKEGQRQEQKEVRPASKNNNIKVKEIEKYINKGISIDEIAEILNIGKGEVLLIKELYIK